MLRLLEDAAKSWLRAQGFNVPRGAAVASPAEVRSVMKDFGTGAVVKALVPAGRRGKAGAVRLVATVADAEAAAADLIGSTISGHPCRQVYVEERIAIAQELYLAFLLSSERPQVILSAQGGVDIESVSASSPEAIVRTDIDPLRGLQPWEAVDLWRRAGVDGSHLRALGDVTARLFEAFRSGDALLLELNPLVLDDKSRVVLVGAMTGIDASAVGRHKQWAAIAQQSGITTTNPRERHVAEISANLPGGECRYLELDGDIGLLVGGGGAGLYQHDRIIAAGGRPANHSVTPPTGSDNRKLAAVISAIFDNPRTRAVLVGFNFAQMARADIRVKTLLEVIDQKQIDTRRLPIVIRLFGAGEDVARAAVAGRPGIHYLPRGASLEDGVRKVVELGREARGMAAA
jgi:succinyl-CoA synthetase beta subunit/citryl-CoA synthetase large subunit